MGEFFFGGFFFLILIFIIRRVLAVLGLLLGKKGLGSREKLSSFECGFDPLRRSRNTFSLRFFILAIVFLIFDVELVLLLPLIMRLYLKSITLVKFVYRLFVLILIVGLVHEFNEGSLD